MLPDCRRSQNTCHLATDIKWTSQILNVILEGGNIGFLIPKYYGVFLKFHGLQGDLVLWYLAEGTTWKFRWVWEF